MVTAIWDAAAVAIITVGAAAAATTMVGGIIDGELISDHSEKGRPQLAAFFIPANHSMSSGG